MKHPNDPDAQQELAILTFAIRLIMAELDQQLLVERGLEAFADFGRCDKVALFLLDPCGETLTLAGCTGTSLGDAPMQIPMAGTPFAEVLMSKHPGQFQLKPVSQVPCPTYDSGESGRQCLCVPLVQANNRSLGVVTFDQQAGASLDSIAMQCVLILQSALAISVENARAMGQLQEAHAKLEALYQAKTKMIDHLSHELKTPLAIISASAKILYKPSVRRDEGRFSSVVERMDRNIARLLELEEEARDIANHSDHQEKGFLEGMIRQCQDLVETLEDEGERPSSPFAKLISRIEDIYAPPIDDEHNSISLKQWVPGVVNAMEPLYRHRNLRLELDLCQSPAVRMPETPLRKVFSGLIRNAVENTPDGGKIQIQIESGEDALFLRVRDFGVGLKEEALRQLFHGFVHTGDTRDYSSGKPFDFRAGGKGLDLLRSKLFAERYGFDIQVESEFGSGSIFSLRFPSAMLLHGPEILLETAGNEERAK